MPDRNVPIAVQQLVWRCLRTVDHVSVLLAVRAASAAGDGALDATAIASRTGMTPPTATTVARELLASGVLRAADAAYTYTPDAALAAAVDALAHMYDTRPVTLVRAVYDRPASMVQLFADAFRLRDDVRDGMRDDVSPDVRADGDDA